MRNAKQLCLQSISVCDDEWWLRHTQDPFIDFMTFFYSTHSGIHFFFFLLLLLHSSFSLFSRRFHLDSFPRQFMCAGFTYNIFISKSNDSDAYVLPAFARQTCVRALLQLAPLLTILDMYNFFFFLFLFLSWNIYIKNFFPFRFLCFVLFLFGVFARVPF